MRVIAQVSLAALALLRLDQVWWLVSPHNPLKPDAPSEDLARRVAAARACAAHPRIKVTGVEAALGTTYTAETLAPPRPAPRRGRSRLDDGGRQSSPLSSLAGLADDRRDVPIAVFNRPGRGLARSWPRLRRLHSAKRAVPAREARVSGRKPAARLGFPAVAARCRYPRRSSVRDARPRNRRLESVIVTRISLAVALRHRAGAREREPDTDHRTAQ